MIFLTIMYTILGTLGLSASECASEEYNTFDAYQKMAEFAEVPLQISEQIIQLNNSSNDNYKSPSVSRSLCQNLVEESIHNGTNPQCLMLYRCYSQQRRVFNRVVDAIIENGCVQDTKIFRGPRLRNKLDSIRG